MNEQTRVAAVGQGRPNLRLWSLRVVGSLDAEPNMRRVVFTADDINEFLYKPGQAIVFAMPLEDGSTGRRHYTIRSADKAAGTISADFFKHGASPSVNWALAAKAGDTIEARGPRGGAWFRPDASWHLITGDETGIPAIAHLLEAMPAEASGRVLITTADPAHKLQLRAPEKVDVVWLQPATENDDPTLAAIEAADLPGGLGHAILTGETGTVRRQRHALIARGLSREQISSEGYWRAGRVGGHDHVDD